MTDRELLIQKVYEFLERKKSQELTSSIESGVDKKAANSKSTDVK